MRSESVLFPVPSTSMAIPSAAVLVSGRGPRHKTALERDRIELGQDDAQLEHLAGRLNPIL